VTGATSFVTFAGVVAGPPSFALLSSLTGGYRAGFVTFAAFCAAAALALLRKREPRR
jgi:MFS-type transporter involved in bile tolerance (Atg22 family)